jgi:hypothetical protein
MFDYFVPLFKLILRDLSKINLRHTLATTSLLFHWNFIDPAKSKISSFLSHLLMKPTFSSQHIEPVDLRTVPRFLTFMLQNLNRLSLSQLTQTHPTLQLPFKGMATVAGNMKLMSFVFDSFSMLLSSHPVVFDINANATLNAPSIPLALALMLKFPELEDRLNAQMQTNQMSARDKRDADGRLVEAKVGVWKICMAMWAVQCRFRES